MGIAHDYKNLSKWIDDNLEPSMEAEFKKTLRQCFNSNDMYSNKDMGKYFKRGWNSVFDPIPGSIIKTAGILTLLSMNRLALLNLERDNGLTGNAKNPLVSL
jgi:hypothetical protein